MQKMKPEKIKPIYLYQYDSETSTCNKGYNLIESKNMDDSIREYTLTYDSPYSTGVKINDRVHAQLFLNKNMTWSNVGNLDNGNNDCNNNYNDDSFDNKSKSNDILILIHGFLTNEIKLKRYYSFIKKINSNNISGAFLNLPFHLNRTPAGEKSGRRLINFDDLDILLFFHQSVVDIKKLIDILKQNWNFNNIYICGISLGCMISVIAMANDNRINKGIFLIGGGNWEEVHWKGISRLTLKGNCIYKDKKYKNKTRRQACREIYACFPEFLKKFKETKYKKIKIDSEGLSDSDLKEVTARMCFLCDPLTFANKINPQNVLMINAKYDFFFNKKSVNHLWEELGRPEIYWLNNFHTTNILADKKVLSKINDFLSES